MVNSDSLVNNIVRVPRVPRVAFRATLLRRLFLSGLYNLDYNGILKESAAIRSNGECSLDNGFNLNFALEWFKNSIFIQRGLQIEVNTKKGAQSIKPTPDSAKHSATCFHIFQTFCNRKWFNDHSWLMSHKIWDSQSLPKIFISREIEFEELSIWYQRTPKVCYKILNKRSFFSINFVY